MKGQKTGGREPGTQNKVSGSLRQMINDFLSENWDQMQTDFKALDPKEKLMFYEKMLGYALPKLQSTTLTTDLDRLSDEQVDELYLKIMTQLSKNQNENE